MSEEISSMELGSEASQVKKGSYQCSGKALQICFVVILLLLTTLGIWKHSFRLKSNKWKQEEVFEKTSPVSTIEGNEISISYFARNQTSKFSKFYCTGSENDWEDWEGRLCIFQKICYDKNVNLFVYYQPSESHKKPLFYDSKRGMLYDFHPNNLPYQFLSLSSGGGTSWAPVVSYQAYPQVNVTRLQLFHILMQSRFAAGSIAHGIWEDFGSLSYSMERMNAMDRNVRIMHYADIFNTSLTKMYVENIIPALTDYPLVQLNHYMNSFQTQFVCFDKLLAGGHLSVFPKPQIKENHGREALFYRWRSNIIRYNGLNPNSIPKSHHIILTNKSESMWTHSGSIRHRAIVNLDEIENFIRSTYRDISVEVVQWHVIPFRQQIEKLLNTTILITPCGGVSLIIPFLPHGAHTIVMDYYVDKSLHGFIAGESASMEGAFLNHIPHVKKQYYQIYGKDDYQWDYPGASDSREAASIIVNTTRLHRLIDKALEEMEP